MADFPIITLLAPQQQVQSASSLPHDAHPRAESSLAALHPGTILQGFIINRDPAGNPIVRTESGDLPFLTAFFLKIGSEVVIRVESSAGHTLAHLLSVDGQPPEVAEHVSAFAKAPQVILDTHLTRPAIKTDAPLPAGLPAAEEPSVVVTATLISAPKAGGLSATPETQLTLKIVSLATPAPPLPAGAAPPAPPPALNAASYAAYARAATDVPQAVIPAAPESGRAAPLPSPSPPSLPPALPSADNTRSAPVPGAVISGTVITNDAAGEALVQTPAGILRLQPGLPLAPGSAITFEVTGTQTPASAAIPAPLTELAKQWSSLERIFTLLDGQGTATGLDEALAAAFLPAAAAPVAEGRQSPVTPQHISTGLMLFIAALRGGDFRSWLGEDATRRLTQQGHEEIIKKAESEFTSLARQYAQAAPGHWQPLFFPVAADGALHQARLFVKRDRRQGNAQAGDSRDEETRFVIEMALSRLGELQMDGFARRQDNRLQFDLVIRSLSALPPEVQEDILRIYNDTGAITGYKGSLSFQAVKAFPVNPIEDIAAAGNTVVV